MTRSLDVAGTVITVPGPDEIVTLSGRFQAMGGALADAQDQLSALASPQAWNQWTGQAAGAFGQTIGQLPGQLAAAQESYHAVAAALSDYAGQLRPVVATLSSLAARAEEAVGNLKATQTARDEVFQQVPDPSLAGWDTRVTVARAVVDGLQAQVRAQQSEMGTLATRCVTRISQALPGGRKKSLLGTLGHDVAALTQGAAGALDDLTIHPLADLWDRAGKLGGQWTWENIGKTLGDVADVLGIIALIPGADVVAVPALIVVSGVAAGADLAAREEHEAGATYTDAGFAAAGAALGFAGAVFHAAGAADTGLFRDAWDSGDLPGLKSLADGTDARVSGLALLKSGIRQMTDWTDVKTSLADAFNEVRPAMNEADGITLPGAGEVRDALNSVSDGLIGKANEFLRLGADEFTHSPAATTFQHLHFLTDRVGEGLTVVHDNLESDNQSSSSQGPPA